jgi:hypothetical protein
MRTSANERHDSRSLPAAPDAVPANPSGRRSPASYAAREWTPERIETLRSMWSRDAIASEIAAALGDVSKSAVIGKLTRLGLTGKGTVHSNPRRRGGRPTHRTSPARLAHALQPMHASP